MDYTAAFAISAAGMNVERARVEAAALNLANAHAAQGPGMQAFQPMRAYEANVASMNTARSMVLRTLEIGRNT